MAARGKTSKNEQARTPQQRMSDTPGRTCGRKACVRFSIGSPTFVIRGSAPKSDAKLQ